MAENGLLIAKAQEWLPQDEIEQLPHGIRGVYILYEYRGSTGCYDVVYIGMARRGTRGRLKKHREEKAGKWTHASVFEVHSTVSDQQIAELEGLFRHIYRKDARTNVLNRQGSHRALKSLPRILADSIKQAQGAAG